MATGTPHHAAAKERADKTETAPSPPIGLGITDARGTFVYANAACANALGADGPEAVVGRPWHGFYDDPIVDAFRAAYFPSLRDTGRWRGVVAARLVEGHSRWEVSLTRLDGGGIAWGWRPGSASTPAAAPAATGNGSYTNRLETLQTIDQAILSAESPQEIARVTLNHAQEIIPFKSATVSAIDWDTETVTVLAASNNVLNSPSRLPVEQVYLSDTLKAGQTEVISDQDYESVPKAARRIRAMGLRSILCLPMVVEGDVIGVVHVGRTEPDAFSEADWSAGRELADHMAIAIRQARLLRQVQRQSRRLEDKVRERTEELEAFTYSVSHDLRTPLRAVDGFSRRLMESYGDRLDDEGRRLLSIVRESAAKMRQLIDDLLALSRLGRHELRRRPVDMEALAETVFRDLRQGAPERPVTLTVQSLPPAHADPSMVKRVLENLLSNALKFTRGTDDPHIIVGATTFEDTPVYFVRDNGVGFDADYADKMFGVFERLHDESAFSGTGVGLAIVERVVRRHDGRVWAEGAEGEGATVYVCLSCQDASGLPPSGA